MPETNTNPRERLNVTIPRSLKERMEAVIPDRQRSAFTEHAIEEALKARARRKAIAMLDNLPSYPAGDKSSEEVLRHYRENFDRQDNQ